MRLRGSDRGALGVPTMVKLAVALGIFGVLGYDTFVTIATHLKAENDAQNAAFAASTAWGNAQAAQQTPQTAYQAALSYLEANEPSHCQKALAAEGQQATSTSVPVGCDYLCIGQPFQKSLCGSHGGFSIDPDATVHLVVRREANTLIFGHLGFMHSLLVAYENGDAGTSK